MENPLDSETFGQDASFRLEQPIGSMSISPSGRDVVLASKEGLHIIDLDSPYSPPRYLPHRTPWEVADVQWSPFASKDYWIVSTSNQKALVWNVGASNTDAIEFVLHAHSRAITDINFSAHNPEILATCAVDSFVHGWDLRIPSRPAFSFSDWFAGATQVKFNRQDEHVIASSHDRFLHIWDKRKGAYPARTIEAHGTKIYGLDWNRFEPSKIVTCSLDKTIKFWDTNDSNDTPNRIIETPFPVWRARHTPFGWGLLAMPQRGGSDLHMYDRRPVNGQLQSGKIAPVTTFRGQKGQVKEFLWRARGTVNEGIDHRDFQLVSWSTDRELRLHRVPEDTFKAIGYEKGVSRPQRMIFTRRGARYRTFRDAATEPYSPSELPIRADSFPSHNQFLGTRARPSTNIGMSKVSVAHFRGWLNGGRRERRTGMHGRATVRQDMNPIAWMKNVKIESWDSDFTDSLADEITQAGDKFKKVHFESVDIGQRKAVMSLQGPWGESGLMTYVRVEWRFPKTYPRNEKAIAILQKTSAVASETHKLLSTEVHTIAETYASRQRGCIEAVVRYLLNEQSMEQIVSYLLSESMTESKILDPETAADDLSSESDDENLNGAVDATNSSANIRMPLPKECGALWSNDGRLICFFPQKPKEPASVFIKSGNVGDEAHTGSWFEGFGRLQTTSPARKFNSGTQGTNEDVVSDGSEAGSMFSSSSSSSSSSEAEVVMHDKFATYGDNLELGLRHRSKSEERSNRSTTLDGTRGGGERLLNVVTIHSDVLDLQPSKRILGQRYRILGDSKEVCDHNAKVAEEVMLPDVASIWRLAGLILERTVSLDVVRSGNQDHLDILFIARRSASSLQRKDSGVDLNGNDENGIDAHGLKAQSRWGNSPLASGYLITAMFNYFERKADVQMLAMLSCIFMHSARIGVDEHRQLPMIPANASNQFVYFPTADIALSVARPPQQLKGHSDNSSTITSYTTNQSHLLAVPNPRVQHQRRLTFQSDVNTFDGSGSRGTPGSGTETPINQTLSAQTRTMSASNLSEDAGPVRRPMSGSAFAASRASLNALAQSYSNSPPSNNSVTATSSKKLSPSASLATGNWSGALFNRETVGRNSRSSLYPGEASSDETYNFNLRSSVSSVSLWELRRDSRKNPDLRRGSNKTTSVTNNKQKMVKKPRKRLTKTILYNQEQFDLDGYADQPLLDPQLAWRYKAYRNSYAEMLGVWDLVLQRAELLKCDIPIETPISRGMRRASNKFSEPPIERGFDIVRCCHDCGKPFAPIEKNGVAIGWHCTTNGCTKLSGKSSKAQVCSICEKVMHGLAIPCLQCGHITCYDCAQTWFTTSLGRREQTDDEVSSDLNDQSTSETWQQTECPTGCGCQCQSLSTITVPYPDDTDPASAESQPEHLLAPPPMIRKESAMSEQSIRFKVDPSPETALGAIMALSSRSRAASTTTYKSTIGADPGSNNDDALDMYSSPAIDELVPWATGKFTTLGRGIGGGLSRGLSNRSSDATIRKV